MKEKELYAEQWNNSADYFYNNGSYSWMCRAIEKYHTILEIGCGTGQSTLGLLENGHNVIVVEKNEFCVNKAKSLLEGKGYSVGTIDSNLSGCDAIFVILELFNNDLLNLLSNISFDAVICWNVGSYWDKSMLEYYTQHMLNYGLTQQQIDSDRASSYGELVQWKSCKIAEEYNVPIHFIDRGYQTTTELDDDYYVSLKKEINFAEIQYDNIKTKSISEGGVKLTTKGIPHKKNEIDCYLTSIIIIP